MLSGNLKRRYGNMVTTRPRLRNCVLWGFYALLVRALWAHSKSPSGKKVHAYWKMRHAEAKTELDRVALQMNCFNAVCALNKGDLAKKAEQWAIAAAPQINAKYPGRVTLVYNDGVEDTP